LKKIIRRPFHPLIDSADPHGEDKSKTIDVSAIISVIIPVYNEEPNILPLYDAVRGTMESLGNPWEMVFVDDGSNDNSLEILKSISEKDHSVKLVQLRRNFGQTAAMSAGIDHSCGAVIVIMDADLQNDSADIPRLLSKLYEGYDIVSGWRKSRKDSFSRRIPSMVANRLISWLTGVNLHDYGCTLKAYRREVLEGIHIYGEMHRFIPALANSVGARITELEVRHHPRKFGQSKYGIGRIPRVILDLLTLKLLLAYYTRPMRIFGGLGMLLLGFGGIFGMASILMKILIGMDMTGNPLLYFAILAWISGIQLIGLGFLAEINMRTYFETQRKPIYVIRETAHGKTQPVAPAPNLP